MVNPELPQIYQVRKRTEPMAIDADWYKPQWQKTKPLYVNLFMGDKPEHFPETSAKVLYDNKYIYVIFRVADRYVRAVAREYQGPVWEDSCVEFFLTPGSDISKGYFNIETNCGGTILFRHQTAPKENMRPLKSAEFDRIEIAHSLPKVIEPEITEPVTWTLEYRFPIEILERYQQVSRPRPGVKWRANFYKCADKTSQPHWLTWSFVAHDSPNFHLPEHFGTLEFVD